MAGRYPKHRWPIDPANEELAAADAGPIVLKPSASPLGKLIAITFVCLFWNGIVSVFVWQASKGWRTGNPDGCLTVFLIPFVLIGLLLIWSVFHQFLALFNPRPRLALSSRSIPLGGSASLDWSFSRLNRGGST